VCPLFIFAPLEAGYRYNVVAPRSAARHKRHPIEQVFYFANKIFSAFQSLIRRSSVAEQRDSIVIRRAGNDAVASFVSSAKLDKKRGRD
jgi:hypothetical protein